MKIGKVEQDLSGKKFSLESGVFAQQANGAVLGRLGDTVVLATAVMSKEVKEGMDYFPLLVDYEERLYAAGKIKGSRFIKREGRATDEAILSGRLIDRSIRPLFPEGMRNDVQVMATILSVDEVNDPDIVAINAASAALSVSNIPFEGPVAAVRIGRVNGEFVLNPSYEQRKLGDLDLVIAGSGKYITMVEAGASQVSEQDVISAIKFAQKYLDQLISLQNDLVKQVGQPKAEVAKVLVSDEVMSEVVKYQGEFEQALFGVFPKEEREKHLREVSEKVKTALAKAFSAKGGSASGGKDRAEINVTLETALALEKLMKKIVRGNILDKERRVDMRPLDQTRPVSCSVGLLPRTHGSGLFNRGETQVLTTVTLGSSGDAQILDGMEDFPETTKRYMHHYNFPGFSVGEVAPARGPGRREVGHGALAERALEAVIPPKEVFPYTLRLVSEVLSSNGSTSMASTCGSCLALMDAGVPISAMIGGIAMGLVVDVDSSKFKVLTDIQGFEDQNGDMDFKVAGSEKGITALQLDVKTRGLTVEILEHSLKQAREGRLHILNVMKETIASPRPELSPLAPRIYTLQINPEKIRDVIGTGGKVINKIISETGVKIDIEDSGLVMVTSNDATQANKAVEWIKNLTREFKVGEVFHGRVSRIMDFGAFVELVPGHEGLVHISELAPYHVNQVEDIVKVGDIIGVKILEIDQMGRVNLSHKAMLPGAGVENSRRPAPHRGNKHNNYSPRSGGGAGRGGPRFVKH